MGSDGSLEISSVKLSYLPAKCLIEKLKGCNLSTQHVGLVNFITVVCSLNGIDNFDSVILRYNHDPLFCFFEGDSMIFFPLEH